MPTALGAQQANFLAAELDIVKDSLNDAWPWMFLSCRCRTQITVMASGLGSAASQHPVYWGKGKSFQAMSCRSAHLENGLRL
jgi:hypothetical protein